MADQAPPPWIIAAFITAVATLAGVVAYLFKRYERRDDRREKAIAEERRAMDAERASWAKERETWKAERETWETEREEIRADYEANARQLSERYAQALREEHKIALDREDAVRAEFATIMANVEAQAAKASQALVEILNKFYDRFVGPRSRY